MVPALQFLKKTILALTIFASYAAAQSRMYTDQYLWEVHSGGPGSRIGFSSLEDGTPLTDPAADTFFSSLTLNRVTFLNVYSYFNQYIYSPSDTKTIQVVLPPNTLSVGMDLYTSIRGNFTIRLGTGQVFTSSTIGLSESTKFVGFISPTPIDTVSITLDSTTFIMSTFYYKAPPPVLTVDLDIIPGSSTNLIRVGSKDTVPVAILSSAAFDARNVDPASVRFGRTGTEAAATKYTFKDVNKDGRVDTVLYFKVSATGILSGDTAANLSGSLLSGEQIQGSGPIRTRP